VRDAVIAWIGRRRELLIHEKVQLRKWQLRAFLRWMDILPKHDGSSIVAITRARLMWKAADGWEHQEIGVELNMEEGPDPLQFRREDWIDQERE
jgi:hypothetical protein